MTTRQREFTYCCSCAGTCSLVVLSHLGDGLCESAAGLVTNPNFILGAVCWANGLEFGVDGLVRECLDAQRRLAGGVQLEMFSQRGVRETVQVYKKPVKVETLISVLEFCEQICFHFIGAASQSLTWLCSAPQWRMRRKLGCTLCLHLWGWKALRKVTENLALLISNWIKPSFLIQ